MSAFYNMDCMEGMKQFPDKYFELAIVDPPYGIGAAQDSFGSWQRSKMTRKNWDQDIPPSEYFEELRRVTVNQIIWGGNYFYLPPTRGYFVWDKGNGFYGRDFAECEYAWTSFDRNAKIYKRDPLAHGDYKDRIHPTQKPVALYKWLLTNYAKQGDKILDTHVGSASSLIACREMGFDYTGYEIDTDYYNAATKRLEAAKAQVNIIDLMPRQTAISE